MTEKDIQALKRIKELLDSGVLSQQEFEIEKEKIIGKSKRQTNAQPNSQQRPRQQQAAPSSEPTSRPAPQDKEKQSKMMVYIWCAIFLLVLIVGIILIVNNRSSHRDKTEYAAPKVTTEYEAPRVTQEQPSQQSYGTFNEDQAPLVVVSLKSDKYLSLAEKVQDILIKELGGNEGLINGVYFPYHDDFQKLVSSLVTSKEDYRQMEKCGIITTTYADGMMGKYSFYTVKGHGEISDYTIELFEHFGTYQVTITFRVFDEQPRQYIWESEGWE